MPCLLNAGLIQRKGRGKDERKGDDGKRERGDHIFQDEGLVYY